MGLETDWVKTVQRTGEPLGFTIFENDQVMLLGDGVDLLPPFQAKGRTGGVLTTTVVESGVSMCGTEKRGWESYGTV